MSAAVADGAFEQLLTIGRLIGAGDRRLALRLIANTFDRDWSEPLDEFDALLEKASAAGPLSFSERWDELPATVLYSEEVRSHIAGTFVAAVWAAMKNPEPIRETTDSELASERQRTGLWAQHGLELDPAGTGGSFKDQLNRASVSVLEFEAVSGLLSACPPELENYVMTHYPNRRRG